jgi:hypothetical protein
LFRLGLGRGCCEVDDLVDDLEIMFSSTVLWIVGDNRDAKIGSGLTGQGSNDISDPGGSPSKISWNRN